MRYYVLSACHGILLLALLCSPAYVASVAQVDRLLAEGVALLEVPDAAAAQNHFHIVIQTSLTPFATNTYDESMLK